MIPLTVSWRWRLGGTVARIRPRADTWPPSHDIPTWQAEASTSYRFEMTFAMPDEGLPGHAVTLTALVEQHLGMYGEFVTADDAGQPITVVLPDCR